MKNIITIILLISGFSFGNLFAQGKGQGKGNKGGKGNDKTVVVVKEKAKGPPPWAPAHGYRPTDLFHVSFFVSGRSRVWIGTPRPDPASGRSVEPSLAPFTALDFENG